jgi:transcriptional regulator with XRE-family HTH domain
MEFKPEKIRGLRQSKNHSLGTVVRLLSIRCNYKASRATVSYWERGKAQPPIKGLIAICQLYEVDPNYFFSD